MNGKLSLDTAAAADFLKAKIPGRIPRPSKSCRYNVSIIYNIELLSVTLAVAAVTFAAHCLDAIVQPIFNDVALKATRIRRNHRLKLPHAVIAATVLIKRWPIYTSDTNNLIRVPGLKLIDPGTCSHAYFAAF